MRGFWRKKEASSKTTRRRGRKNQGIITVFVTLIMVPVVVITGILVDVARLKMYSSQAVMAADSYGDAVLSEFDNVLKELYGLFSVAQSDEGKEAILKFAEYTGYSFHPNSGEKEFSDSMLFMPYQNMDVEIVYENYPGASLSNNNVLETQISDFMRFRVIEEVLEEAGILSALMSFDNLDADMSAMNTRKDMTDSSRDALGQIDQYYQALKKIGQYPAYLTERESAYKGYRDKLVEYARSDGYAKYVYYLNNRSVIDAAYDKVEAYINADEDDEVEEPSTEDWIMHDDQYMSPSEIDQYKANIRSDFDSYQTRARDNSNHSGGEITFDNMETTINTLGTCAEALRKTLQDLQGQVDVLRTKLNDCSAEVREGMEQEIKELEDILALADDFEDTYNKIVNNDDILNNSNNKHAMVNSETGVPVIDDAVSRLIDGTLEVGYEGLPMSVLFIWYDFMDDKKDFYDQLCALCESGTNSGKGDKNAGDKAIEDANAQRENAENQLKEDETPNPGTRDISDTLASQLKSGETKSDQVPNLLEYFSDGLSFEAIGGAGVSILDKFLVSTYDFGMFSSRVSGIKPEDEEEPSSEEYADYSLTKVKMSGDINYLYGAELEYLFGGHNESKKNLNEVRNIICGVRLALNFTSSYLISEVNDTINLIANTAAEAVAVTGVGAAAAPLVRIAVSGALRMAFATIETAADWKSLKERKSTVLLKRKLGDLESTDLSGLLGDDFPDIDKDDSRSAPELTYENYLYVLMCLLVDNNTLLSRTSNLITLNVNQATNTGDTLTTLNFKMENTVTAIKSTCKVKVNFVVVPENMAEMFLSGSRAESIIESLEDSYFGYSIIRGY